MLLTDLVVALEAEASTFSPALFARTLYARHASPATCWEAIRLSPFHQASLAALREKAGQFDDTPASSLPFSLYRRFDETGDRSRYENAFFEHRARLNAFAFETTANNWSAVCAGAVGIAAMYLIPGSRTLAPVLKRCMDAMEVYLSGFTADGACTEGLGY